MGEDISKVNDTFGGYLFCFHFQIHRNLPFFSCRNEDAEREKDTDLRAAHYLFFQQALRELYNYHLAYPWDTTIKASIEMLAKKMMYTCEDGKEDQCDSSHIDSSCAFCSDSFTLPAAPIPITIPHFSSANNAHTNATSTTNNNNNSTSSNSSSRSDYNTPHWPQNDALDGEMARELDERSRSSSASSPASPSSPLPPPSPPTPSSATSHKEDDDDEDSDL